MLHSQAILNLLHNLLILSLTGAHDRLLSVLLVSTEPFLQLLKDMMRSLQLTLDFNLVTLLLRLFELLDIQVFLVDFFFEHLALGFEFVHFESHVGLGFCGSADTHGWGLGGQSFG